MGLEGEKGVQTEDVTNALLGHVKEGYEVNKRVKWVFVDIVCSYISIFIIIIIK